ncbi:MAG: hypothetical protein AB1Z19_04105, partial [Eubacteriales bacterium]
FCVMWIGSKLSTSPEIWYKRNPGKDYLRLAEFYESKIGSCKIVPISYDFNQNRLIDSFIDACQLEKRDYQLPKKAKSNVSANKYVVEVMNDLNHYIMDDQTFFKIRERVLNHEKLKNGPKAIFYSNEERRQNNQRLQKSTKAFIEKYNHGQPLFEELKDIDVPAGLDKETKQKIVQKILDDFKLDDKRDLPSIIQLKETLQIPEETHGADLFREIALIFEHHHLYQEAYRFMKIAHFHRKDGPFIIKKMADLEPLSKKKSDITPAYRLSNAWILEILGEKTDALIVDPKQFDRLYKELKTHQQVGADQIFRVLASICDEYGYLEAASYFLMLTLYLKPNKINLYKKSIQYQRMIYNKNNSQDRPLVYLHMGANKAASTSIQCSLSANRDGLKTLEPGYFFAKSWGANHSRALMSFCNKNSSNLTAHIRDGWEPAQIKAYETKKLRAVKQEIEDSDAKNFVFSGEDLHFLNRMSMMRVRQLLSFLIPNCDIHVIFYVRGFAAYLNSGMQQSAKSGRRRRDIIRHKLKKRCFYKSALVNMSAVFGKKNLIVRSFEEAVSHPKGPVGDFFKLIGLSDETINDLAYRRKNESVSNIAAQFMFYINEEYPLINKEKKKNPGRVARGAAPLKAISGSEKYSLERRYIRLFYPMMKKEAAWLKKNYGIDYSDYKVKQKRKPIIFDDQFAEEMMGVFDELSPVMQHLSYRCCKKKSKKLLINKTSKRTFAKLATWCENTHADITRVDFIEAFVSSKKRG